MSRPNSENDAFISHSKEDKDVALEICQLLEDRGINCWIAPRDVQPGRHYAEEILTAIEETKATIVLLSEHSNKSTFVRNEIERAVSKGKPVLPIRIRNVSPSRSLELYLSSSQWIDAWTPPLVKRAEQIVAALNALITQRSTSNELFNSNIGVIALGGGAIRASASLANQSLDTLRLIASHTYRPTLESSKFPQKIQLGKQALSGQNAGGDPIIGLDAVKEADADFREALTKLKLVFVISCLGGGTGTGAAPFVCSLAREMGVLTVGVVTTPFQMEGTRRERVATLGLSEISGSADSVVLIPNQGLLQRGITSEKAFSNSNIAITNLVISVSDLIIRTGFINVDFSDVQQIFNGTGIGRIGIGRGSGEKGATTAAEAAIRSPLLEGAELYKAKSIIIYIKAGPAMTLDSFNEISSRVHEEISENADVVLGNIIDDAINNDEFFVTLIAMGV